MRLLFRWDICRNYKTLYINRKLRPSGRNGSGVSNCNHGGCGSMPAWGIKLFLLLHFAVINAWFPLRNKNKRVLLIRNRFHLHRDLCFVITLNIKFKSPVPLRPEPTIKELANRTDENQLRNQNSLCLVALYTNIHIFTTLLLLLLYA